MALETAFTAGSAFPGPPAHWAHMVPPASRTPPAALHLPALGDCFSFRFQNALSAAPEPSWLRVRELGASALRAYLPMGIALFGRRWPHMVKEIEGGREEGRKERNID